MAESGQDSTEGSGDSTGSLGEHWVLLRAQETAEDQVEPGCPGVPRTFEKREGLTLTETFMSRPLISAN